MKVNEKFSVILLTGLFLMVQNQVLSEEFRAGFYGSLTSGCVPHTVTFYNQSTGNPVMWDWHFQGGSPSSAVGPGPHTVTYNQTGAFTVTLEISNSDNIRPEIPDPEAMTDEETKTDYIHIFEYCYDFGDAPDSIPGYPSYATLNAHYGAKHYIVHGIYLGDKIDDEQDGQPQIRAEGDDLLDGNDDEDGVTFVTELYQGQKVTVDVQASVEGFLNAWVDFNRNGDWGDPGEQIFQDVLLTPNPANRLYFNIPGNAITDDTTFARFRFCTEASVPDKGPACNGEVEDYYLVIKDTIPQETQDDYDYGDAPCHIPGYPNYPTLDIDNGAKHTIVESMYLGYGIDEEQNGQPYYGAWGDDQLDGNDDEDGVNYTGLFYPGQPATVYVRVTAEGYLNTWVDFNRNGNWGDPGEHVVQDQYLTTTNNQLNFDIPLDAHAGDTTIARFRFSSIPGLSFTGGAPDGEVEDHYFYINKIIYDFGDAPDSSNGLITIYPTDSYSNGARHQIVENMYMGSGVDGDPDGQPHSRAEGDDLIDGNDDEDGVTFTSDLYSGLPATIEVDVSAPGYLNAWLDFNRNGDWGDSGDQIFTDEYLTPVTNTLTFTVSPYAHIKDTTFARFRFSSDTGLTYTGPAIDGEVEDYYIVIDTLISTSQTADGPISLEYNICQNYPNPFNPATTIEYRLPRTAHVHLILYDIRGRKVKELVNGIRKSGVHRIILDASSLSSGIYYSTIRTPDFTQSKKIILMK